MSYSLALTQAIFIVIYVADKVRQGIHDFVPTKELSQNLNIARPTAVKILQSLSGAGIIETREGAKGGIRLALAAGSVSILDILHAIEAGRPLFRQDHRLRVQGLKPDRAREEVQRIFGSAENAMKDHLAQTSIADLLETLNS